MLLLFGKKLAAIIYAAETSATSCSCTNSIACYLPWNNKQYQM